MFHVIVGIDGSAPARGALEWASSLARELGGRVVAVNAHVPVQSEMRPGFLERLLDEQHRVFVPWCASAIEGADHEVVVVAGDPREKLPTAVAQHGGDLLVVASTGASGATPGTFHFGSVAEYLARNITSPLAVIPSGAPTSSDRIVLAVDGSRHGAAATRWLAGLLTDRGTPTPVTAVFVHDGPDAGPAVGSEVLSDWIEPLLDAGIEVDRAVVVGMAPVDGVLSAAEDLGADLIVMGMRGAGGFSGLRLGGVALGVVRRTSIPVVLVPPDPE